MTAAGAAPRIRPATAADAAPGLALVRTAYAPHAARMGREPAPMRADLAADIAAGRVWAATRGDALVGVMTLEEAGDGPMLLDSLAAWPAGAGVGGALLDFALARAQGAGRALRLYTHASMVENRAWYRRRGFAEVAAWEVSDYDRVYFEMRP